MFADKNIKGIFALRGGYGCARLLNLIDFKLIKKNPKIFVGYSDITALHIAINQKSKLITYHGPMISTELIKGYIIHLKLDPNYRIYSFYETKPFSSAP